MADTILSGDLTVYYLDESRRKQIRWTGGAAKTAVQKMIDVYDATEDLFTIVTQQDDGLIFSAETPGEYTIGIIDAGDEEPWFIDLATMEHIVGDFANFTGCALKTNGWARVTGTNTGIVVVPLSSGGSIGASDIGDTVTNTGDSATGTLLDIIITGGSTDYAWIRPTNNTATHDWSTGTGTLNMDGSANSATISGAAVTGEMVWGNFYTQGALVTDTHVYVLQNGVKVTANDQTDNDWWPDGQIDRAIPIKDYTTAAFPTIDQGFLTVRANQYTTGYSYAIIRMNTTTGGNVSAPLSSGTDSNNTTGYASITFTAGSGSWNVGDEITGDTSGARAKITRIDNPGATQTLHYYLIGDPLTDFQTAAEGITNADTAATGTKDGNAPSAQGPALTTWFDGNLLPTYSFANTQVDVDDDGTPEEYGITIDLNQASIAQMHEYNKYVTRRGSTFNLDGVDGEQWIGIDYAVNYSTITGTVAEGSVVTGVTSGATGTVVSNPGGSSNTALLRDSRGTFVDGEQIQVDGSNYFAASGLTVTSITPVAANSFGDLAGGRFFASRGVVLIDYKLSQENSWQTIDATGATKQRPTSITMTISNLKQFDWASCFRLTGSGGTIDKTEYSATGGETLGGATLTVDGTIAADVPNKDNGGHCILRDQDDNNQEYHFRFSSFVPSTGVVTLANTAATATAGTTTTNLFSTGNFTDANVDVGDIIVVTTPDRGYAYVKQRVSDNEVLLDRPITGLTSGDSFEINSIPSITVNTLDDVYFPIILEFQEADGSASASMQYVADIFTRVRVRNTSDATTKIKGFTVDITIGTGGGSAITTRIPNTVYGS